MKEFNFDKRYKDIIDSDIFLEIIKQYQEAGERTKEIAEKIRDILLENEIEDMEDIETIINLPKTCYPGEHIYSKAKVNNLLFEGKLNKELQAIATEGIGQKQLTVKASIDMEELEGIQLSNQSITPYDREVHDSIVSLVVDGGNRYITPLMIYRTMTGNPRARLPSKNKNFNDITHSIERLSRTRVYIDATAEIEDGTYFIDSPVFKENVIYSRSISGRYNGQINEWIEILETPVLYRYANSKNQVARMDIKLLNTPINKNEENIVLQGYIQKRILDMKGSRLSRNILYETIYKKLDINSEKYKNLRVKQSKIRNTIKEILDYWEEEKFINGYEENPKDKKSKVSISILL